MGAGLGTIALAANIADGDLFNDPTKALGEIGATTAVGYSAGKNLAGHVGAAKDWASEKILGTEEYSNLRFDQKFYQSDGYKMIVQDNDVRDMCRRSGVSVGAATQMFLDAGETDASKIRAALKNGISGDTYATYKNAGIDNVNKIAKMKKNNPRMSDPNIISWMKLAENSKGRSLADFKTQWIGKTFGGRVVDDATAESIYKQLVNFF